MSEAGAALERVFRRESGVVLASLIATVGDFDLAEDAFQDAVEAAAAHWPKDGVPRNPAAWLTTTARRKAIDRVRRAAVRSDKQDALRALAELSRGEEMDVPEEIPDERLRLLFTCCHPALALHAQVALTLRTLGGLTTPEIARAFLVPEPTLAQRLARAKKKIAAARIPYRVPEAADLPERLEAVLAVVYLIFNEGYAASSGDAPVRRELCAEAIRLGRVLAALLPDEPEALGLLALMLLHDSRRDARVDADGVLVPLEDQDRTRWDAERIREGRALLERAARRRRPGPYQLQAAISAAHAESPAFDATDWPTILALYTALERCAPSPVVTLNRAVALSMTDGPEPALALIEGAALANALDAYQPFHATRADLLRRCGRASEAALAYRTAIALSGTEAERRFLERRLARLAS
ncbi:MAG: RNA polymerase sigma factor [Myxococcota bacterium]